MSETGENDTELTRQEGPGRARKPEPEPYLERGTLVGRYVILDRVGEGGMGVVYSAFDPELDRKVAIKLLQASMGGASGRASSRSSAGDQAWLLREAQAMARLHHPNVVAVHDVGTLAVDRVWVAMELVDGVTLRSWLKSERTWREVVAVMLAAGAGLAAAHAAGLVHRDFKPDNVLVGKDGRVYVMDFGLARLRQDDETLAPRESDLRVETRSPLSASVSIAGVVIGTPAYIAPEIYKGHPADARTDQFAFGVALYEALYRTRPFDPKTAGTSEPPAGGTSAQAARPPPDSPVPARIRRLVMRAIAVNLEERYPSMDDLLAELAIDPAARRRRVVLASGITMAIAATIGGAFMISRSHDAACKGADRRLGGIWDPATKQTIRTAFDDTKKPFAKLSYAALERALDQYTADWAATSVGSCEATRIRRDQTEEVMSLRQECLDQRLEELHALTNLLATAEGALVDKGDRVVAELEPINRCSNVAALRLPGRPPPGSLPKLEQVRKTLADAKAQLIAGRYFPALTAAKTSVDAAKQLGYDPVAAEAMLIEGVALSTVGNVPEAATSLEDATWAGMRGGRDDIVALAALASAMMRADIGGNVAEARLWLKLGQAAAVRVGVSDQTLELRVLEVQGLVEVQSGNLNEAVAAHEKAFALAQAVRGGRGLGLWAEEAMLAATLAKSGAYAKAAPHLEHAITLREATVGPDHTDIALMLSNLGSSYSHAHENAKARTAFERALAIRERTYGPKSPMLVLTLNNLADHLKTEDIVAASKLIERAKQIAEVVPGRDHPIFHTVETTRAELLTAAGKYAEARAVFEPLIVLEDNTKSPMLPTTLCSRGDLALAEHDLTGAEAYFARAVALVETTGGKDSPELWRPLTGLARTRVTTGDTKTPRPLLDRAIAVGEKAQVDALDLAPTRELLGQLPN
ncbi:MAG: hypothetical protein JWO36_5200 [Myxococcales bacterium]|nr:hypothetical protein [Myxococcales bacterium]